MRIAYVSGPYRSKTLRGVINNIRSAEAIALDLWGMGFAVICPHTNTQLFECGFLKEYEVDQETQFVKGDLEFLSRLHAGKDVIVMIPGWIKSDGAKQELNHAVNLGIKAYHWPRDKQKLRELNE